MAATGDVRVSWQLNANEQVTCCSLTDWLPVFYQSGIQSTFASDASKNNKFGGIQMGCLQSGPNSVLQQQAIAHHVMKKFLPEIKGRVMNPVVIYSFPTYTAADNAVRMQYLES